MWCCDLILDQGWIPGPSQQVQAQQTETADVVAMSGTCVLPFVNSFWEEAASALFMRARVSYFGSF